MSTKKMARTRQAERKKERQDSRRRGKLAVAVLVLGALLVIATALIFRAGNRDRDDGRVWSAAHGHWHDR